MRTPLVIGNWKMNGTLASARALATEVKAALPALAGIELAVCPPFVHLPAVSVVVAGSALALGAQDLSEFEPGAYTGEVAAAMLLEFDVRRVLVGHSERRAMFGDSNERVLAKVRKAIAAGLDPVLCVGETLAERQAGRTEAVVGSQLDPVLGASDADTLLARLVIAYEPVWAIGTGETATPEQAEDVHRYIRGRLAEHAPATAAATRVLYGGSVKASNAAALFAMPNIDGGLIGGAALKAEEFIAIGLAARARLTA